MLYDQHEPVRLYLPPWEDYWLPSHLDLFSLEDIGFEQKKRTGCALEIVDFSPDIFHRVYRNKNEYVPIFYNSDIFTWL